MKTWGLTEQQIHDAADEVGVKVGGWPHGSIQTRGRALMFTLAVDSAQERREDGSLPYQRVSTVIDRPRRIAAVCWHGHRDFFRALLRRNPEARILTALADYRGVEDFERKYRATFGEGNAYNLSYGQACTCSATA